MAKTQALRRRMKSVKNIHQITKTMEMVAASKLHRSQEAALHSRAYAYAGREALARLRVIAPDYVHPLFAKREIKTQLIIMFASDRGLAGAYNANIIKKLITALEKKEIKTKLIVVGQKAAQFVSKIKDSVDLVGAYTNWPTEPNTTDLQPIVSTATKLFSSEEIDSVSVLYTDYVSTIRQTATLRQILPINPEILKPLGIDPKELKEETLFEPSPTDVLNFILPRLIEVQIYQANLEAIASENAMRMMAMKNASDNADELMEDLSLTYNGVRQAAITQELSEITSGAEAIS